MRTLCTIQRITSIEPIPDADKIEVAKVLGWQAVIKKGEFQVGDLVIFCEIDSVMPDTADFQWLKNRRIKTMRLRGCLSQGLVLPLTYLPTDNVIIEGLDVTKDLNVTKYQELSTTTGSNTKGDWPSFLVKSGATRLQSIKLDITNQLGYVTEKLDGTSATYYIHNGDYGICSRNLELKLEGKSVYHYCDSRYDISQSLRDNYDYLAIQGEIVGPGVQGNRYELKEPTLFLYTAYDIMQGKRLNLFELHKVANKLGIPVVPVLGTMPTNLSLLSHRQSSLNPTVLAEGIVIDLEDHPTKYKLIDPEYLLKHNL